MFSNYRTQSKLWKKEYEEWSCPQKMFSKSTSEPLRLVNISGIKSSTNSIPMTNYSFKEPKILLKYKKIGSKKANSEWKKQK
jgi:hypothetical protein